VNYQGQGNTSRQDNPSTELTWLTSFDDAMAESKKSGKPVMVDFSATSWCIFCKLLEQEVFSKPEFKRWASEKVVLLKLEYPRSGVSEENAAVAQRYGVRGYPTILFLNADGAVYGKTGYVRGGAKNWLPTAHRALANKTPTPVSVATRTKPLSPGSEGALPGPKLTWLTSYKKALAESKRSGKPVMADFTGSTWCGFCIALKREVFSKPEFKRWAKQNVVLLELDYPRPGSRKRPSRELSSLAQRYGVRGYPTILFLNAKGAVLGKTGYVRGGVKVWLTTARRALANSPKQTVATRVKARAETPKYPDGSAENAVVQLALHVENEDFEEMKNVISDKAKGLLKDLRSGNPSAGRIKRAQYLFAQVKPSGGDAKKLPGGERQFTLINKRGLYLDFKCRKENGKFVVFELKSSSGKRR